MGINEIMYRGIFLDRDGVINELVYYAEHGVVDSPFTVEQFRLLPGVCEAINNSKNWNLRSFLFPTSQELPKDTSRKRPLIKSGKK